MASTSPGAEGPKSRPSLSTSQRFATLICRSKPFGAFLRSGQAFIFLEEDGWKLRRSFEELL